MTYNAPPPPSYTPAPQGTPFRGGYLALSPPWLNGDMGSRYMFTMGLMWDTLAEETRLGVIQRYPSVADPSALPALGRDRGIIRGISETDAGYAQRLRKFKATWKLAGNAPTLLNQLWGFMGPSCTRIRYVVNGYSGAAGAGTQFADWWTIDNTGTSFQRVSPSNWDWDGAYGYNIRFWIIVYRSDLTPAKWGVPPYSWGTSGLKWSAAPGSNLSWIADTYNIVNSFKAAGSHMGPWPGFGGGLIVADPTNTSAPWDSRGPFDPTYPAGHAGMPQANYSSPLGYAPGAVYLSGL